MSLQYYDDSTGQLVEQVDLGGVAQESSVQALVTLVTTLQSRGVVKSVQKGSYHSANSVKDGTENGIPYKDFTINAVNVNKAVIIVYGSVNVSNSNCMTANGKILNSTKVRIYSTLSNSGGDSCFYNAQWQVIEFY